MPTKTKFQASIKKIKTLEIEEEFEEKISEIVENASILDLNLAKVLTDSLKREMKAHFEHAKATHNTLRETLLTDKFLPETDD